VLYRTVLLTATCCFVCRFLRAAVAGGGLIWSRYSTVITPVNWNLLAVNFFMAGTGIVQLYRKFDHDHTMARATEAAKTQYGNATETAKAAVESATL
jgi:hypothetical protein